MKRDDTRDHDLLILQFYDLSEDSDTARSNKCYHARVRTNRYSINLIIRFTFSQEVGRECVRNERMRTSVNN